MRKDTLCNPTEWEWLKQKLEVRSLVRRGSDYAEVFHFDGDPAICCRIHSSSVQKMASSKLPRSEQLVCFQSWARSVKREIEEVLRPLPVLRQDFDFNRDLVIEIMHDYGTGATLVCSLKGDHVEWH